MVKKLQEKESLLTSDSSNSLAEITDILTDFTWEKENTDLVAFDKTDTLSPVYGLLNSIISDFKELDQAHQDLKIEFYDKLQFQVGEILHQEASLRGIFDSLDSMVWMVDSQFNFLAFNKKFHSHLKAQYGIVPEVGMNILEQEELSGEFDKTIHRINIALKGEEENYRDFYSEGGNIVKVVDSKIFPVEVHKNIQAVACLTNDITESFEASERIKSNEHIIASVNKNISEAIYRSSHDRGLIFVNEAFVQMFGFRSKEELYNHSELNSIYANPDDRERLGKLLIKEQAVTNVEVKFRKKNGETLRVL